MTTRSSFCRSCSLLIDFFGAILRNVCENPRPICTIGEKTSQSNTFSDRFDAVNGIWTRSMPSRKVNRLEGQGCRPTNSLQLRIAPDVSPTVHRRCTGHRRRRRRSGQFQNQVPCFALAASERNHAGRWRPRRQAFVVPLTLGVKLGWQAENRRSVYKDQESQLAPSCH